MPFIDCPIIGTEVENADTATVASAIRNETSTTDAPDLSGLFRRRMLCDAPIADGLDRAIVDGR
jgi:hypothetical protein